MKIVPVLAITNALALALAIFVYVKQGDREPLPRRSEAARGDSAEIAQLRMEIDELRRAHGARGDLPEPAPDAPTLPSRKTGPAPHEGVNPPPLASQPPEAQLPSAGDPEEYDPQEMQAFRRKVRKANELNEDEDQEKGILDRVDQLVKQNKIAPLTPAQKEGVAKTVLASRRKGMEAWRKLREGGTLDNATREDRGRIARAEFEALRTETQRALEEFMPAADVKTYLEETTRDQGRFGGFGGAPQPPGTPAPGR